MDYFKPELTKEDVNSISILGLAHLGDGVFEVLVRSWLCCHGKVSSRGLHKGTVSYVSAPAQARSAEKIMPYFTEEEAAVYKRGRNARVNSVPKNANKAEYHASTGFEAVFGWLYLRAEHERMNELFAIIMQEEN